MSLTARPDQITAVMGTNGVGKTSLLKAIAGRHPYAGGSMELNGSPLDHLTAYGAARAGIAYVPQGREIVSTMTVAENLETGFACLGGKGHSVSAEIFDLFPVLRQMMHRRGGDLSGGQQQLAIARALITRPKVLLLDEPTEGIQPNIIKQIGDMIRALRDRGDIAFVLVEQVFDFAFGLGDHFVVMTRGDVVMNAPTGAVERTALLGRVSV